ncbi:MAG: phosphoadenosine phosphosulfate reductase, partial [Rhodobacteraceae bacterium]|nr:phosphoadenosine phosphosulfate reductase [Paracoccaceae bacterium]
MSADKKPSLFGRRMQMDESIQESIDSLNAYIPLHDTISVAWSGGKDSTATLTFLVWAISTGKVPRPKRLIVFYADTRLELLPLVEAATRIMDQLAELGIEVRQVMAPIERRFFPYMLGRGVPPSSNTFRWCTPALKIEPMKREIDRLRAESDVGSVLMITGVRLGESAARDQRISVSCSKNGAECGQGWYTVEMEGRAATLAPLLHWRVCHVWAWLRNWAPLPEFGEWDTELLADAYGGDEAEESQARTGCIGCPLASRDTALEGVVRLPRWSYLRPLLQLKPLYWQLKQPRHRLRKATAEIRQDGQYSANPQRMGPLTLEARLWGLSEVRRIEREVNEVAKATGRPTIDLINPEEEALILRLIEACTWPDGWAGTEPQADQL